MSFRRIKPTFSFAAMHNAKRRDVKPTARSPRFHPYQRIQPPKSDGRLKVSYRGILRTHSNSPEAPSDSQYSPLSSTQQTQSFPTPPAMQLTMGRDTGHTSIALSWLHTERRRPRSLSRSINPYFKIGKRYFASPPTPPRSPRLPKRLSISSATQISSLHSGHQTRRFSVPSATPSVTPRSTKFTYSVAASYIAKGRQFKPSVHVFQFNPYHHVQPPKPHSKASRPESGQDAFFVSRLGANPSEIALGVADGVGGWIESGVDSADVSHGLCDYMAAKAHDSNDPPLTARQLLTQAYEGVCHDPKITAGGTTATVALLKKNGTLEVANLGDSGYILLRLNGVHAASEPQIHAFNTPYQLSVVPPAVLRRAAIFGGTPFMDMPRDAEITHHNLRHGDVLILASDGVWDNLFSATILQIVSRVMRERGAWRTSRADAGVEVAKNLGRFTKVPDHEPSASKNLPAPEPVQSALATQIVDAAQAASKNKRRESPFEREVRKYYPQDPYTGGKIDDICVVVAVVSESADGA